jgi:hypothetical protein
LCGRRRTAREAGSYIKRTFKKFVVVSGGTPQPLIGTTLTAATGLGGTDPNGDQSIQIVAVADSSMFQAGDWIVVGSKANSDEERVLITTDVDDSTHIEVKLTKTHVNGSYVRLSMMCQSIYVQTTQGNTGAIYLGTQGLVKATQANVAAVLYPFASPTQPIDYSDPYRVAPDGGDCGEYWIDGTTNDGYLPSLTIT